MTAATYGTNLTDIVDDTQTTSATGWSALGGGGAALNPGSTELFIEDTEAMTKDAFGTARKGMIYNAGSDQGGLGTDGAYSWWCTFTSVPSLDTKAGAGFDVLIGSGSGDYDHYHVFGSDTFPFGGWFFACVQEDLAGDEVTGTPTATQQYFGVLADATAAGAPSKGETIGLDTVRAGRHDIVIEFGTTPDADATFDGVMTNLETATNRWGMMVQKDPGGAFENSGLIQFGTSTNEVNFTDSNKVFFLRDHDHTTTNFHTWEFNNASSVANLTNIFVKALGTTSPGRLVVNDDATVNLTTCTFVDMGTFTFDANTTADSCTFLGCGAVTANEADLSGSSFLAPSVAADDAAVIWDETLAAAETISELDNCTFSQGTNAHHAITFGTGVDEDITLTGIEFTDFDSTADANGATLEFLATAGSLTCTLIGCTVGGAAASSSNVGVDDAAGITVTVAVAVPVTITVVDEAGDPVSTAQTSVYLSADDTEVMNTDTNGSGVATASFTGTTPAACYIRVRKGSTGATKYFPTSTTGTIAATTGLTTTVVLREDTINST